MCSDGNMTIQGRDIPGDLKYNHLSAPVCWVITKGQKVQNISLLSVSMLVLLLVLGIAFLRSLCMQGGMKHPRDYFLNVLFVVQVRGGSSQ